MQKSMAKLFDVGIPAISQHPNNIFEEEELRLDSTISKIEKVDPDTLIKLPSNSRYWQIKNHKPMTCEAKYQELVELSRSDYPKIKNKLMHGLSV